MCTELKIRSSKGTQKQRPANVVDGFVEKLWYLIARVWHIANSNCKPIRCMINRRDYNESELEHSLAKKNPLELLKLCLVEFAQKINRKHVKAEAIQQTTSKLSVGHYFVPGAKNATRRNLAAANHFRRGFRTNCSAHTFYPIASVSSLHIDCDH